MSRKLTELNELKAKLQSGGGDDAIKAQHAKGKQTVRERLAKLFDAGTFVETGLFVKARCVNFGMDKKESPADGVITGFGQIKGRLTYVAAQDFTVIGGSLGEMHADKIASCQEVAMKVGAPMICIYDTGGARIQEGLDTLAGFGKTFFNNTQASGVIPQISVIMGPCIGAASYSPAITDFILMVDKTSQMFMTGPQVIEAVTGEAVTSEELGGAITHNTLSGVAHFHAANEDACIEQLKQLLSYLPQNNMERAEVFQCNDDLNRLSNELNDIIPDNPNKAYEMKDIIRAVADNNIFFETQCEYAKNILTGFIRLNGKSIGVVASEPSVMAGCLDINASDKASRFIRTCDSFNIPILTFEDVHGYLPKKSEEHGGIIRHGAKLLFAYSEATVPMVTVITRKAYGSAYIAMASKHVGADIVYAWPEAEIAVMGSEAAANIIFAKDIMNAPNPQEERMKKISEYNSMMMNPYVAASRGYVDDVIEPATTRKMLIAAFDALESKVVHRINKKHGNIPL